MRERSEHQTRRPGDFVRRFVGCWIAVTVSFVPPMVNGGEPAEVALWSFRPLERPESPRVRNAAWVRDDLDRFILAKLQAAGLEPHRDADRYTLIRRAAFDLIGLPPTARDIDRFVNDPAPTEEAFARVVDGYLDSPCFGERWGRHWLDVARYADSVGRLWNAPFTYAWRYRDYVIDAFNDEVPYDRFIVEQLAGDRLPAETTHERRRNLIACTRCPTSPASTAPAAGARCCTRPIRTWR
ncbi:MAG: DUF1549 domain-containing protein [Planctomycetes bacterium]|nr:DUF1549 domain-containing protein [Planctomycetota bacterium]